MAPPPYLPPSPVAAQPPPPPGVPPSPPRVYETILYASDVAATAAFYREVVGLRPVIDSNSLMAAFRLNGGAMLLIFDPSRSSQPGRPAPSHGAQGAGHMAFAVDPGQLASWRTHLESHDVAIEQERSSSGTGQIYVRDPAGNSVEFVEGEIWPE